MTGIPLWKIWLSYFTEVLIESAPSDLNPHMYVSLKNGRLQLSTANAIYSYDTLYHNFAELLPLIDPDKLPGRNVLILGFGLGSVPLIIEKLGWPEPHFTGVELDPRVIELASKYALPRIKSPITLLCTDAQIFTKNTAQRFGLIVVDIFLDDLIPEEFTRRDFFHDVKNCLEPGGLVIMNTLGLTEEDNIRSEALMRDSFGKLFPEVIVHPIRGNRMLLSSPAFFK